MNRLKNSKLVIVLIILGVLALLFSLGIQQYKVLTNSRANEDITPTVTVTISPEVTATPTPIVGSGAGYVDMPIVPDDSYTPPLALDQITAEMKQSAYQGGFCNIDTKECTGWAWKFVCTVDADIVWNTKEDPSWNAEDSDTFYNRHCTKKTGQESDIGVKYEQMFAPTSETQVYKLDDVACGKLVQVDVTVGNCEPDGGDSSCRNIKDALVYYTGACPLPTPTYTPTPTLTPLPTNTPTITPSNSPTPTNTPVPSNTPTVTLTPTLSPTPTITLTPTVTLTPTITNTPAPTNTPVLTNTPGPTSTPGPTFTPQPTYIAEVIPTTTPITKLIVNNQAPGTTPWLFISIPIGLILLGLLL